MISSVSVLYPLEKMFLTNLLSFTNKNFGYKVGETLPTDIKPICYSSRGGMKKK